MYWLKNNLNFLSFLEYFQEALYWLPVLGILLVLGSCRLEDDGAFEPLSDPAPPAFESFTFGHFYGFCGGEACVEIFRLTTDSLFEDTLDNYPSINPPSPSVFEFVPLTEAKRKLTAGLPDLLPSSLLMGTDSTYGCPDCADQGGLYVEYQKEAQGPVRTWILDQSPQNLPSDLIPFRDTLNAVINQLQ